MESLDTLTHDGLVYWDEAQVDRQATELGAVLKGKPREYPSGCG